MEFSTDWLTNWLTACLIPSDQHNSTMAIRIHVWFFTVRCRFIPRSAFWHTAVFLHGLTSALLCVPFIFADSKKSVNSVVSHDGFLFVIEKILYFSCWLLWLHSCFSNTSQSILGWMQLETKSNGYFAFQMIIDMYA